MNITKTKQGLRKLLTHRIKKYDPRPQAIWGTNDNHIIINLSGDSWQKMRDDIVKSLENVEVINDVDYCIIKTNILDK